MRTRFAVAAAALALFALPAPAQKPVEPTLEVRIRSVNDLADRFEYVAELAGQEEPAKQAKQLLAALTTDKGIEGLDPKRPFGVYAALSPDVANSPVVLMVPIADEDRFREMLKERLSVTPEKTDGGAYKVHLPLLPEPAFMRFANGYLYLARLADHVTPAALVDPKAYFAKDDGAILSVVAHLDRIPDDLKKVAFGQFELKLNQDRKRDAANENAAEKVFKDLAIDALLSATKSLFDDAKMLTARVVIDPKADELAVEFALAAKDGSPLAASFAAVAGRTSLPAGIAGGADAAAAGGVKLGLTPEYRRRLSAAVDRLAAEAVRQAKPNEQAATRRVADTFAPTGRTAELDVAFALTGPDAKGKYGLRAAAQVAEGKGIEQLAKDFAFLVPETDAVITFDVEKAGAFALHKVELKKADAGFDRLFGSKTLWLATSADCLAVGIGEDRAGLREALKDAKPAAVGVASSVSSLTRFLPLAAPGLKPDEAKALIKDAFGDASPSGKDTIAFTVEGGKQLTARLAMKGKAVRLGVEMQKLQGK